MDAGAKVFTTRWLPVGRQSLEYQWFTTRESTTSKRIGQDRLTLYLSPIARVENHDHTFFLKFCRPSPETPCPDFVSERRPARRTRLELRETAAAKARSRTRPAFLEFLLLSFCAVLLTLPGPDQSRKSKHDWIC